MVDRIEGRWAVVEYDGAFYNVPRGRLKAGQVYRWTGRSWVRDKAERLRASDPGGNIQL